MTLTDKTFSSDPCDDPNFSSPSPDAGGGRGCADHGLLAGKLCDQVDLAMTGGQLPLALATAVRRAMTGAIWNPAAIRATTDVMRALATGAPLALPDAALDGFSSQMVFAPLSGLGRLARRDTAAARWLAAVVIVAFATSADRTDQVIGLVAGDGRIDLHPAG
jgi:hypothetical protein